MVKRELVWLIVRLIGLVLIYNGIHALFGLLSTIGVASEISTVSSKPAFGKSLFFTIMQQLLITGLYLGIGFYALIDGAAIFGLLDSEDPPNKVADELEETSLKLDDG